MVFVNNEGCPIWGDKYGSKRLRPSTWTYDVDSPRADGAYSVSHVVFEDELVSLSPEQKARLTTWLVDQRLRGTKSPEVTTEVVDYARRKPLLPVHDRADRLLQYLARLSETAGDEIHLQLHPETADQIRESRADFNRDAALALERSDAAFAWSDSTEFKEVGYFLGFLHERGWLVVEERLFSVSENHTAPHHVVTVTVDGYSRIADQATNVDTSQAFVAMWFDESMGEIYDEGFRPAIEEAGYSPLRIDQKPDINKIDDEIIAEIRRSRFMVADFTHGDEGARGGVYFEAGFAYGLDIS